jgi:hypothetical protein
MLNFCKEMHALFSKIMNGNLSDFQLGDYLSRKIEISIQAVTTIKQNIQKEKGILL